MAKILIADDSATAAALLSQTLTGLGHSTLVARDGEEAAEKIRTETLDLVILDVIMPGINGYQLCRSIRSDPDREGLPIIFVTAMDRDSDRYWGLKQGADEYLVKPVDPGELARVIERQLGRTGESGHRPRTV